MKLLIGDRDGEVKVLSYGWIYGMYIDLEKANELVIKGYAKVYDSNTLFLTNSNYEVRNYIKERVLERDSNKCSYCEKETNILSRKQHRLLGGKLHSISNYMVCCPDCATIKSHKDNMLLGNVQQRKEEMLQNAQFNKEVVEYFQNKKGKLKKKKPKSILTAIENKTSNFKLYCDASFSKKRKTATIGYLIEDNKNILYATSVTIFNVADNNIAELLAIEKGVLALKKMNIEKAQVLTDSKNAAILLRGKNKKENKKYRGYVNTILHSKKGIEIVFTWVRREHNKLADKLSKGEQIAI